MRRPDQAPETVFALSTGAGRAALAVIRLSGPEVETALAHLGVDKLPAPRQAAVRKLYDPEGGALLDEALVLRFVAPHSFTGEDMAELHVHGGLAVTQSILAALAKLEICTPAEAGEFTRRAVLNAKMDLTGAEAIADLIDAEGGAQQAQALRQMSGSLRQLMESWRETLKTTLAHVEADIEFADEDLPGGLGQRALEGVPELAAAMQAHLQDTRGLALRDGLRVALLGAPNAGKSSILNRLSGKDAAIVSARAGTTRDVIEVAMVLGGVPVTLVDTAGLREAGDDIEREGVRRAKLEAEAADIRLLVLSPDTRAPQGEVEATQAADLVICNKADLGAVPAAELGSFAGGDTLSLSTLTGEGETALLAALQGLVTQRTGAKEAPVLTRERHRQALSEACTALERALAIADTGLELAAEDLRLAQRALGRITGAVDIEQLLDIVFADFCIGK
ncbi:MAG: tRNA uridine-5-carboxymethylaminomethyl(34) synthesis GTPase MnmE [Alphaproteobacteria bacterium]|nr:tRNA uridine-5-carboxymethylaminomethyl(34) synthesis GTPase MnmE [Alphaproteobacteria bacterium]